MVISKQTARRFVLGCQGLWPGRRWKGRQGTARALRCCEAVQLDPLAATARSQDLVLHSRVLAYQPDFLDRLMYRERLFFDYGGWLAVYPMSELPYWRVHMDKRSRVKQVEDFVFTHPDVFEHVRAELRARGPLGNRDLDGRSVDRNYRGSKETSLALYDMWISGELMIHHRENFARVYDFREKIAPAEYEYMSSEAEAEEYFARKCVAFKGLLPAFRWKTDLEYYMRRKIGRDEMHLRMKRWIDEGILAVIQVDGWRGNYLMLAEDMPLLHSVARGGVPRAWKPLAATTLDEVTFLSSLDIVSARGRAKQLFDFEYLWEVYKPAHQRRWGYYTLPILYGDELVARLDPKLERASMALQIKGYWQEQPALDRDPAYVHALANGLVRFAEFLGARRVDLSGVGISRLKRQLKREVEACLPVGAASST